MRKAVADRRPTGLHAFPPTYPYHSSLPHSLISFSSGYTSTFFYTCLGSDVSNTCYNDAKVVLKAIHSSTDKRLNLSFVDPKYLYTALVTVSPSLNVGCFLSLFPSQAVCILFCLRRSVVVKYLPHIWLSYICMYLSVHKLNACVAQTFLILSLILTHLFPLFYAFLSI